MKNLIILALAIFPFISACKKDNETQPEKLYTEIREIAWNDLNEQEKSSIIIDWKQAHVDKSSYNNKEAYVVTFNTSSDALLGPIMVYVDASTKIVLGHAPRD